MTGELRRLHGQQARQGGSAVIPGMRYGDVLGAMDWLEHALGFERSCRFVCLLLCYALLVGAPLLSAQSVAGIVTDAATHKPLVGVLVTVRDASLPISAAPAASAHTGKDGSFSVADLSTGQYWILGSLSGYMGAVYGFDATGGSSISLGPAQELHVALALRPAPPVRELDLQALSQAYPARDKDLYFRVGSFSPDGMMLALCVSGIKTGDIDQVWLADLRSGKMVPASPKPSEGLITRIGGLWWQGDTLLTSTGDPVRPRILAATMEGFNPSSQPAPGTAVLQQVSGDGEGDAAVDGYKVTLKRECHGCDSTLQSTAPGTNRPVTISRNVPDLSFVYDPASASIFYATQGWSNGFAAVDLRTHRTTRYALATRSLSSLLAVHRAEDRLVAAYADAGGSCQSPLTADGEMLEAVPGWVPAAPRTYPMHVCLADLPVAPLAATPARGNAGR